MPGTLNESASGQSIRSRIVWIFLIALLVRVMFIPVFDFALDDAYITFRVARNIAEGHGMVLNPGQNVLAITTPLYALLMVPGEVFSIGSVLWSKILNSVFAAGSCALIYILLFKRVHKVFLYLAVVSMIINPISIFITLTGMESALVSLLLLLSVFFYREKLFVQLGLVLGLLCITRPEGCIAAFLFWAAVLIFYRNGLLKLTIPLVLICLSWFLYAMNMFGSAIPNSYLAKQAYFSVIPGAEFHNIYSYLNFFKPTIPFYILSPLFLILGIWTTFSHKREFLPLSIWLLSIFFLQLSSDFYLSFWYMHMLVPVIILILFLGIDKILNVFYEKLNCTSFKKVGVVVLVLALFFPMIFFSWQWRSVISDMRILDSNMSRIAEWFVINRIPENKVVGLEAIGRLSYETNLVILDRMGLASPEVIPLIQTRQDNDANIMCVFQPDYYVTGLAITSEEAPGYSPVAAFSVQMVSKANDIDAIMEEKNYIYARTH